jgi:chaperonin cofactor prefoldin
MTTQVRNGRLLDAAGIIRLFRSRPIEHGPYLGGSTTKLVQAQRDAVAAAKEEVQSRIDGLEANRDSINEQIKSFIDSLITPLQAAINSIRVGPISALAPKQQSRELRGQLDDLISSARAGDVQSIQTVGSSAQQYLQFLKSYSATGSTGGANALYQSEFVRVNKALGDLLTKQQSREMSVGDIVQKTADQQLAAMERNRADVVAELKEMNSLLRGITQLGSRRAA